MQELAERAAQFRQLERHLIHNTSIRTVFRIIKRSKEIFMYVYVYTYIYIYIYIYIDCALSLRRCENFILRSRDTVSFDKIFDREDTEWSRDVKIFERTFFLQVKKTSIKNFNNSIVLHRTSSAVLSCLVEKYETTIYEKIEASSKN